MKLYPGPYGMFGFVPPGTFRPTLNGLGAAATAIPLSLRINNPVQQVGREGHFYISNAPPNSKIYWTSFKDGQYTGEENAYYGNDTSGNGSADLPWTPAADHVGDWIKIALVQDGQGKNYYGQVQFRVIASDVQQATAASSFLPTYTGYAQDSGGSVFGTSLPSGAASAGAGSFLSGDINIAGIQVPKIVAYGGGALLLFQFFGKKR
jgi:hypothetical protein